MSTGLQEKAMGRPKRAIPGCTVRMDADIVKMAKMIAAQRGTDAAGYLSAVCRSIVERDFAKLVQKTSRKGEEA